MKIERIRNILIVQIPTQTSIKTVQDLLDIFASVSYHENCYNVALVIDESSLTSDFFELKTGVAGEMLQKFSNYNVKLSITGDFAKYKSNSLQAFIRECNRGKHIFFAEDIDSAKLKILSSYQQ